MRMLVPRPVDEPDLHADYAHQWLDGGGVRATFVTSLDGAVSIAGSSRGLQTPGDQRIFRVLRDLADVVVVGRTTAVTEQYRPVRLTERRAAVRSRFGLPATLPTAVVSASLNLDPAGALFDGAPGAARTIVLTCAAAGAHRGAALAAVADVVVAGNDDVDLAMALDQLRARGLTRILIEGGPRLFTGLLGAHAVDELCLSVVPRLVGATSSGMTGRPLQTPAPARLIRLYEQDGATFHRYVIDRA